MTDYMAGCTSKDLADFACKFEVEPFAVYRGWYFQPMFYGAGQRSAYRKSRGLEDKGHITTAWDNGTKFKNQADRNRACVLDAAQHASQDKSRGEVLRAANDPTHGASRVHFRALLMGETGEDGEDE